MKKGMFSGFPHSDHCHFRDLTGSTQPLVLFLVCSVDWKCLIFATFLKVESVPTCNLEALKLKPCVWWTGKTKAHSAAINKWPSIHTVISGKESSLLFHEECNHPCQMHMLNRYAAKLQHDPRSSCDPEPSASACERERRFSYHFSTTKRDTVTDYTV
jgi:hypothetical protein